MFNKSRRPATGPARTQIEWLSGALVGLAFAVAGATQAQTTRLGQLIVASGNSYDTDRLFVPIVVLALGGVGLTRVVEAVEARLARWKLSERAGA